MALQSTVKGNKKRNAEEKGRQYLREDQVGVHKEAKSVSQSTMKRYKNNTEEQKRKNSTEKTGMDFSRIK